jgi:glycine rich protein
MNLKLLRRAGGAFGITVLGGLLWSPAAQADTATYVFTGTEQAFIVPAGVTTVHVVAVGAQGGTGFANPFGGAFGAESSADVPVTPGQLLYVEVGGMGGSPSTATAGAAGFNGGGAGGTGGTGGSGGGGGGGASDVRTVARFAVGTLNSRLVIAAGGGGSGGGSLGQNAGGGGLTGGPGGSGGSGSSGSGGTGGGGATTGLGGSPNGQPGLGGPGGNATGTATGGGGGGGAGLFGGGGGIGGTGNGSAGGSGGGGSSGVAASISNFSIGPADIGTPSVTFTWAAQEATTPAPLGPTGQRAAAIKKCKKKFAKGPKRTKCIKRAKRLPA